jgi:hypothetical protein
MNVPSKIRAGTTIIWEDSSTSNSQGDSITAPDWTLKFYFRTLAGGGYTATGAQDGNGWKTTISATDSGTLTPGDWYWSAIASKASEEYEVGNGTVKVFQSLSYSGSDPSALDDRTQVKKDLEAVTAAIRAIISDKAKEYSIGGRTFKRLDLPELRARESQLKAEVVREEKASMIANNLGNPHSLFVRF